MTGTRRFPDSDGERGIALITALLMMMVMSALAIALTASGRVEIAMGDNEELYAGARSAAESGLNHTAAIIIQQAANPAFDANTLLRGPDGLSNPANEAAPVNADNNQVSQVLGGAAPWSVPGANGYTYDVRIFDDDDPILKNGTAFTNAELTAMGAGKVTLIENGQRFQDVNRRLVIRSTGFGPQGTTAVLEQMLVPITMPALLVDGDLLMSGNASIQGDQGSVHANGNLTVDGNSVYVQESATATGTFNSNTGSWEADNGITSGGMPRIPLPNVQAINYYGDADFVLQPPGPALCTLVAPQICCPPGAACIQNPALTTTYCNATASTQAGFQTGCRNTIPPGATEPFGFRFNPATAIWDLNPGGGGAAHQATYYVRGHVAVTGSPGTAMAPLRITLIAEGNIEVTGNPDLRPEPMSEIQFVTNMDLRIAGDITIPTAYEGRILVREQIHFAGSADLAGQVIVQNVPSISTLVTDNTVTGNVTLTYNGLVETVAYTVAGWRETQ
jgi:Tfp pilus assembly protein PilX